MPQRTLAALVLVAAAQANGQIPDRFTNLQVLPKDITRQELVRTMRGWAGELGVRCHHCHVGPDDLQGMDFATDEKPTKRAAREMARLVQAANASVKSLPPREAPRASVSCYTCHRRSSRPPLPMSDELQRAMAEKGVAGAVERYKELRRSGEVAGRYDFGSDMLGTVVFRLAEQGKLDDALVLAQLAVEQNPAAADSYALVGEARLRKGERAAALESFRKALERDPKHPNATRRVKELEEPAPAKTP